MIVFIFGVGFFYVILTKLFNGKIPNKKKTWTKYRKKKCYVNFSISYTCISDHGSFIQIFNGNCWHVTHTQTHAQQQQVQGPIVRNVFIFKAILAILYFYDEIYSIAFCIIYNLHQKFSNHFWLEQKNWVFFSEINVNFCLWQWKSALNRTQITNSIGI